MLLTQPSSKTVLRRHGNAESKRGAIVAGYPLTTVAGSSKAASQSVTPDHEATGTDVGRLLEISDTRGTERNAD